MVLNSIKIDERSKRLLEELQAILQLDAGTRYSLQDILAASTRLAYRRRAELLEELEGHWQPLDKREIEKLLEEYSFEGPEDASETIDEAFYS